MFSLFFSALLPALPGNRSPKYSRTRLKPHSLSPTSASNAEANGRLPMVHDFSVSLTHQGHTNRCIRTSAEFGGKSETLLGSHWLLKWCLVKRLVSRHTSLAPRKPITFCSPLPILSVVGSEERGSGLRTIHYNDHNHNSVQRWRHRGGRGG